jgi:threonine dehydratase
MRSPDVSRIRPGLEKIDPVFLNTPTIYSDILAASRGIRMVFKDERASPIRSFKGRGAELVVQSLPAEAEIVCASAGNFGQGMAWATRRRGGRLQVFAAVGAASCKVAAMRALGAEVILRGADFDEAKDAARAFAARSDKIFVEDGAHAEIAEGAGTIALELTDECDELDAVFVPLGNGSLATGIGCWFKRYSPRTRVVAVVTAGAPAMGRAVLGQTYKSTGCATIADGIAIRVPVPAAIETVRGVVDRIIFVSEADIRLAMKLIEDATCDTVEAAGAAGLAGLLASSDEGWRRVAVPICGGNRDLNQEPEDRAKIAPSGASLHPGIPSLRG